MQRRGCDAADENADADAVVRSAADGLHCQCLYRYCALAGVLLLLVEGLI
jgi:hypothetical protein